MCAGQSTNVWYSQTLSSSQASTSEASTSQYAAAQTNVPAVTRNDSGAEEAVPPPPGMT